MKGIVLASVLAVLLCAATLLAHDKNEVKPKPKGLTAQAAQLPQSDKAKQDREALIVNINNMHAQEIRVAVIQQVLSEEVTKLNNIQAAFCNQYKLDLNKLRQGGYRYDDAQRKFVEQPAVGEKK